MMRPKKLEHLSLASLFNLISHFRVRPEPTWVEQISVATNALPYLASLSVTKKKCYNIDTRSKCGMRLAVFAGDDELDLELFLFSFSSWKKMKILRHSHILSFICDYFFTYLQNFSLRKWTFESFFFINFPSRQNYGCSNSLKIAASGLHIISKVCYQW